MTRHPHYQMVQVDCPCGGDLAWRRHLNGVVEITGCVCHHHADGTPLETPRPLPLKTARQ